jgi:hypothetical protein
MDVHLIGCRQKEQSTTRQSARERTGKIKNGKSFREGVVVQKKCLVGASHGQTGEEKLSIGNTANRANAMRQEDQLSKSHRPGNALADSTIPRGNNENYRPCHI